MTASPPARVRRAALALALLMMASGCTPTDSDAAPDPESAGLGTVLSDDEVLPLLAAVPERSLSALTTPRLAEGLVPPTNRWFSGLVFGPEPQPVFPLPLSFRLGESGFAFGVPTVRSQPGLIAGAAADHVAVQTEASRATVTRFDEVSVTITLSSAAVTDDETTDDALAAVTIARGSPVVSYTARTAHTLTLDVGLAPAEELADVWTTTVDGQQYALVAPGASVDGDGREVSLSGGATANWVAVPTGAGLDEVAAAAASPIASVVVDEGLDDAFATTTLRYLTADGSPTLIGSLPHHRVGDAPDCSLGTLASSYGPMAFCVSDRLVSTAPVNAPPDSDGLAALDLAALSAEERSELRDSVQLDAAALPDLAADTYFGGKGLARTATLLTLASGLDMPRVADALAAELADALRVWSEPAGCETRDDRCFVYDPAVRGLVGLVPSFGSEDFNDHHFHYGSFLYAAAIAVRHDPALLDELRPTMTLLAADIAGSGGAAFPPRRAFDAYSGHSWASGGSPFADGNNQESSSEAVAAHHAVALWGAASGDTALDNHGRWMLAIESLTARSYWTQFDTTMEPYASFDRGVVGIVWDGKRDYATWFSPEPAAILGIQLLPMRPGTAASLAGDAPRIRSNVAEATAGGPAPQFADYLLMYEALAGPDDAARALEEARELPLSSIDDGNSRSYLLAWIMTAGKAFPHP